MRLAYVCLDPGVPVFGNKGCSIHCQAIMRALQQRGHEVELFAARLGGEAPDDLASISSHQVAGKLSREPAAREQALIELNSQIQSLLGQAQDFDLVYERFSLWSFSAMHFANHRKIPGILEVNAPLIEEQKKYRTLVDEASAVRLQDECFRCASSLIAVSEQVAEKIRHYGRAADKTIVIPNGVDCDRFRVPRRPDPSRRKGVGFVGTLKPWHGVSILLDAFALAHTRDSSLSLKIVGAGPEEQNLKNQLSEMCTSVQDSVEWLGAIPNSEMAEALATFEIAVAPYPDLSDFYFSPLKILEYMASGRAIVASRIGQIPDLIFDEYSGLLVKPGCQDELADAILRLSANPELRDELGAQAQRHVSGKYDWLNVVDQILTVAFKPELSRETV